MVRRAVGWAGKAGRAGDQHPASQHCRRCLREREGEVMGSRCPSTDCGQDGERFPMGMGVLMPPGLIHQWDFCPGFRDAGRCPSPQVWDEGWDVQPGDHPAQGLPIPIPTPQQGIRSLLPPPKARRCHPPHPAGVPSLSPASHHQAGYQGRRHGGTRTRPRPRASLQLGAVL